MDRHNAYNSVPSCSFYNDSGYQYLDPYSQTYQGQRYMNSYPFNPVSVPEQSYQRQTDSPMSNCSTTSSTDAQTTTASNAEEPAQNSKSVQKPAPKSKRTYDTWPQEHQELLVQLWAEHHESLESKDARNTWRKICEELNERAEINKTVEKCKKKMTYLIDKYKNAKEWNKKQTGGHKRKSLFYDEIDAILGCRDVVTMEKVAEAGTSSSSLNTSSSSITDVDTEFVPAKKEEKVAEKKAKRNERKGKKRRAYESDEEDEERKAFSESLKSFKESGEKLGTFMDNFAQAQQQQTAMMNQFLGALTQFMTKGSEKDKSS